MDQEQFDYFEKLPQGFRERFIKEILSHTTPEDVFRLSLVSKFFRSSANSNIVWEIFIPSDHRKVIMERYNHYHELEYDSKSNKEIFKILCEQPLHSYKDHKYLTCLAETLVGQMEWEDVSQLFIQITGRKSVYGYPVLGHVVWLEIHMRINTSKLSPKTTYTAYLEFRLSDFVCYGIHLPIEASVGIPGEKITKETVYFDPRIQKSESNCPYPYTKRRQEDLDLKFLPPPGPLEVKLGDYFNKEGENRDVEIIMKEVKSGKHKCGIHFASIEMRPKRRSANL